MAFLKQAIEETRIVGGNKKDKKMGGISKIKKQTNTSRSTIFPCSDQAWGIIQEQTVSICEAQR